MCTLPLVPAGECLFSDLPARAIVIDALAPAIGDGIITMIDGDRTAVLVVRHGGIADAVSVVKGARQTGAAAVALVRSWDSATVSCSRLTPEAMSLLGPLLHGEVVYADLRLEWTSWSQLLDDLRARGQTFVVELQTPSEHGVTVIRGGEQIATFSRSHPALSGSDVLDQFATGGNGCIRVLADCAAPSTLLSPAATEDALVVISTPSPRPASFAEVVGPAVPVATGDDANATLSSLFGFPGGSSAFAPAEALVPSRPVAAGGIGPLVPELKSLARERLRRSSTPVEEAIDLASGENQGVDWLVARVRLMRVRGFVPETFESLADEMQALALKT